MKTRQQRYLKYDWILRMIHLPSHTEIVLWDPLTKGELLKHSASIYAPLRILNPLTVKSKLLLQSLWQRKIHWDKILPEDVTAEWVRIKSDIEHGTTTVTPRYYFSDNNNHARVIHIFTDASMKAYGAWAYIVAGKESSFVMAKNKVARVKKMTIPKLELMAAIIGAKLADLLWRAWIVHVLYCEVIVK